MPQSRSLKTQVAAPGRASSERLTTKPARQEFVCTETAGAGIDIVSVEGGGQVEHNAEIHAHTRI